MLSQSDEAALVNELFNENLLDTMRSSVVYDEEGHVIKLSLFDGCAEEDGLLEFPEDFHHLTYLRELYLYIVCQSLPSGLCQLPELRALVLARPMPVEGFPPAFAQLRTLRYLGLGEMGWSEIPAVVWQLPQLRVLDLSENWLTSLPPEIGQLTGLHSLYLYNDRLTQLPAAIGQLTQLEELGLSPHHLHTLPEEIVHLRWLAQLDLSAELVARAEMAELAARLGMVLYPHPRFPVWLREGRVSFLTPPYPCACCGYLTRQENETGHEICPVCYWESDFSQRLSPSLSGGANWACLIEARLNVACTRALAFNEQMVGFHPGGVRSQRRPRSRR